MNELATTLGVSPALIQGVLLALAYLACKATSRLIPDNATSWKAAVRNIAGILSVDISSRLAPGNA